MKEKEKDGKGRRGRRLREAVDGPKIRAMYAKMPTKELARLLGLTVRQLQELNRFKVQDTDDDAWYTLDGVRLSEKPSQKGIYIHGGKKVVVK